MLYLVAALLVGQVQIISEPTAVLTLAPVCQCTQGGECLCGDDCQCEKPVKESKPVISVVNLRIDELSPVTIAPDPDNDISTHPDLFAFIERHKDGKPKVWKGPKLAPAEVTEKPRITNQEAEVALKKLAKPAAVAPLKRRASPHVPSAQPPAIDRAVMQRVYVGTVCVGGRCEPRYEWRPVSQQPTKSAQRYQPRRARWR
jgi:hypothetical protein